MLKAFKDLTTEEAKRYSEASINLYWMVLFLE